MSKTTRVFFATGDSMREVNDLLRGASGADNSQDAAEQWIASAKADYVKRGEENPGLWDKQRIFRVTIEEVERKR